MTFSSASMSGCGRARQCRAWKDQDVSSGFGVEEQRFSAETLGVVVRIPGERLPGLVVLDVLGHDQIELDVAAVGALLQARAEAPGFHLWPRCHVVVAGSA